MKQLKVSAALKRNGSIDIFRVIVSMAIVMIHFGSGVPIYSPIYNTLGRMGVPFFFIVTGYFYFRKQLHNNWNVKSYCRYMRKTFSLWVFWSIIFIPRLFLVKQDIPITPMIVLRSAFGLDVTCGPLWYLIAAVEGLALAHICYQKLGVRKMFILLSLAWVCCALGSGYNGILPKNSAVDNIFQILTPETSVIAAFFWFGIALFLVKYQDTFRRLGKLKYLIICTFLWGCEVVILHQLNLPGGTDMFLLLVPESVIFFSFLLTFTCQISPAVDKFLCDMSLYIYILQMFAGDLVNTGTNIAGISEPQKFFWYFWLVLTVDILLALCVILTKRIFMTTTIRFNYLN